MAEALLLSKEWEVPARSTQGMLPSCWHKILMKISVQSLSVKSSNLHQQCKHGVTWILSRSLLYSCWSPNVRTPELPHPSWLSLAEAARDCLKGNGLSSQHPSKKVKIPPTYPRCLSCSHLITNWFCHQSYLNKLLPEHLLFFIILNV